MTAEQWKSGARRHLVRVSRALALLLAAMAIAFASAAPASALGGPGAGAPGNGSSSSVNLGGLAEFLGLALVISVLVACRVRIARERVVRRFRVELASADWGVLRPTPPE